jgi:hypothetical protein
MAGILLTFDIKVCVMPNAGTQKTDEKISIFQ